MEIIDMNLLAGALRLLLNYRTRTYDKSLFSWYRSVHPTEPNIGSVMTSLFRRWIEYIDRVERDLRSEGYIIIYGGMGPSMVRAEPHDIGSKLSDSCDSRR